MLEDWIGLFDRVNKQEYSKKLRVFLDEEYQKYTIYPSRNLIYNSFNFVNPKDIKVVIIGQDPYHEPNQAMGLCFSVPTGVKLPPSLVNIYKEIEIEYGIKMKTDGDLTYLAKQGCLLLNTILTVRAHQALSHNILEYKLFTKDVLNYIDALDQPIVFMLWGNNAKKYQKYIHHPKHIVLVSAHPSPLSANQGGWFHHNHFIKCNEYLSKNNLKQINWNNN